MSSPYEFWRSSQTPLASPNFPLCLLHNVVWSYSGGLFGGSIAVHEGDTWEYITTTVAVALNLLPRHVHFRLAHDSHPYFVDRTMPVTRLPGTLHVDVFHSVIIHWKLDLRAGSITAYVGTLWRVVSGAIAARLKTQARAIKILKRGVSVSKTRPITASDDNVNVTVVVTPLSVQLPEETSSSFVAAAARADESESGSTGCCSSSGSDSSQAFRRH